MYLKERIYSVKVLEDYNYYHNNRRRSYLTVTCFLDTKKNKIEPKQMSYFISFMVTTKEQPNNFSSL